MLSQPATFSTLTYIVSNAALGYSTTVGKSFVTGTPTSNNQVQKGVDATATLTALYNNLVAYSQDGNTNYTLEAPYIYIDFNAVGDYSFTLLAGATAFSMVLETVIIPELLPFPDFEVQDLAIEIIDTYTNERFLQEELTQKSAPQLSFDAGDDLLSNIMISKLSFNLYVADKSDAKYKHLFTSDENRFLVKLSSVSPTDEFTLMWQGFILPDQYSEPYVTGPFFVNFVATDLLGSLKGKTFSPWYYNNVFPIGELLAEIFKATGLEQNTVVKPSVIPGNDLLSWRDINVPLLPYFDGKKYGNMFEILSDVLKANLLFLYSYKGFWNLEGLTRRKDVTGQMMQFDIDGKIIDPLSFEKKLIEPMLSNQSTQVISISPYKTVNILFEADGTKNLYSENVIKVEEKKIFGSYFNATGSYLGTAPYPLPAYHYVNVGFNNWLNYLGPEFEYRRFNDLGNMWRRSPSYTGNYNMTEASALTHYLECSEKPFVKPGILYSLKMEFFAFSISSTVSDEVFKERLENNEYDKVFPWQVLLNGQEKFSNRPSFDAQGKYLYEVSEKKRTGNVHQVTFELEFEFRVEEEGYFVFRNLAPILNYADDDIQNVSFLYGNVLELNIVEDYEITENIIANREINFTQVLDYDTKLSSTVDTSIKNNMGLGFPINTNYFTTIDCSISPADFDDLHLYSPNTALEMHLGTWQIDYILFLFLFIANAKNATFLEKATGEKIPFSSFYYVILSGVYRLGYLKDYTGYPNLPKNYKKYTDLEVTDVLKTMLIIYNVEAIENRLSWKIFGTLADDLFNKTIAKAIHCVYPDALYRIEGSALVLLFPDNLIEFYFDNDLRNFIPTTLNLDLFNGKTTFVATEAKFTELTDISYE